VRECWGGLRLEVVDIRRLNVRTLEWKGRRVLPADLFGGDRLTQISLLTYAQGKLPAQDL
jgi:hypothetical protein